jgi:hypothetical protein
VLLALATEINGGREPALDGPAAGLARRYLRTIWTAVDASDENEDVGGEWAQGTDDSGNRIAGEWTVGLSMTETEARWLQKRLRWAGRTQMADKLLEDLEAMAERKAEWLVRARAAAEANTAKLLQAKAVSGYVTTSHADWTGEGTVRQGDDHWVGTTAVLGIERLQMVVVSRPAVLYTRADDTPEPGQNRHRYSVHGYRLRPDDDERQTVELQEVRDGHRAWREQRAQQDPEIRRMAGDTVCGVCGELAREHPYDPTALNDDDKPFLHVSCKGERWKLLASNSCSGRWRRRNPRRTSYGLSWRR